MKFLWRAFALAVVGVALASCTYVPSDSTPKVVANNSVPFNLLRTVPVRPVFPSTPPF